MNTTLGIAMLVGRFLLIIPTLAIAGSLARKQRCPQAPGTFPTAHAAVRRAGHRRDRHRRRAHVPPRARARSDRRAARPLAEGGTRGRDQSRAVRAGDRPARGVRQLRQAEPAHADAQPGDVRRRGRQRASRRSCSSATSGARRANENVFAGLVAAFLWFTVLFANFAEAVAEGRGKAQADTLRRTRQETIAHRRRADGAIEEVPSSALDVDDSSS